jgi:hypothetical protein
MSRSSWAKVAKRHSRNANSPLLPSTTSKALKISRLSFSVCIIVPSMFCFCWHLLIRIMKSGKGDFLPFFTFAFPETFLVSFPFSCLGERFPRGKFHLNFDNRFYLYTNHIMILCTHLVAVKSLIFGFLSLNIEFFTENQCCLSNFQFHFLNSGQDPYPREKSAVGVAFNDGAITKWSDPYSPSFRNIIKNVLIGQKLATADTAVADLRKILAKESVRT